jgi:hypothetical protein
LKYLILFYLLITTLYGFKLIKKGDTNSSNTLLVIAGIHGNEPGSYFSAALLSQYYTIEEGSIWIIPNLNRASIIKNRRGIFGDMNRKFLHIADNDPERETIEALKQTILQNNIGMVLNLHDGHGFYRQKHHSTLFNPNAWGQTCVIDQCHLDNNSTYKRLNAIANKVTQVINNQLLEPSHAFNVKNTKTKFDDEAMQHSLTYFAVTHNKAAFAIETSKNLSKLSHKVYYQLLAIESFMKIMKIKYTRTFDLKPQQIQKLLKSKGKVTINGRLSLPLGNIKKHLSFIPLQSSKNNFVFSNVLGTVVKSGKNYSLYIGNERVTSLQAQLFPLAECDSPLEMVVDGEKRSFSFGSTVTVSGSFSVVPNTKRRVNVIGFSHQGMKDESGTKIAFSDLVPRYSVNESHSIFRVELYRQDGFCGMILVQFNKE